MKARSIRIYEPVSPWEPLYSRSEILSHSGRTRPHRQGQRPQRDSRPRCRTSRPPTCPPISNGCFSAFVNFPLSHDFTQLTRETLPVGPLVVQKNNSFIVKRVVEGPVFSKEAVRIVFGLSRGHQLIPFHRRRATSQTSTHTNTLAFLTQRSVTPSIAWLDHRIHHEEIHRSSASMILPQASRSLPQRRVFPLKL